MTSFPILDLVVGMIFIYFLLSIVNNSFYELFAAVGKVRAKILTEWMVKIFATPRGNADEVGEKSLGEILLDHPILNGLSEKGKTPSYIHSRNFAVAFIEVICSNYGCIPDKLSNIKAALENSKMLPASLKNIFLMYVANAEQTYKMADNKLTEIELFIRHIEDWFDKSMERLGGSIKRKSISFTIVFASLITIALNIDSVSMFSYLYSNPEARQKLSASAYAAAEDSTYIKKTNALKLQTMQLKEKNTDEKSAGMVDTVTLTMNELLLEMKTKKMAMDTTISTINSFIPIGWHQAEIALFYKNHNSRQSSFVPWMYIISSFPGWLISILAICLGAPFWFDILGKIANIRSSVKPQTAADEEEKKQDGERK